MIGSIFLTVEHVIAIHDSAVDAGVRDHNGLEAAVDRCQATWDGKSVHASLFSQAAALLHGISESQAFVDGNKRAAWLSCDAFLALNGTVFIEIPQDEVVDFMEEVGTGIHTLQDIAFWIALRTVAAPIGGPGRHAN
jgi:death-on-curing protein